MLAPGWVKAEGPPRDVVTLEAVADHIDHICQIAGNSAHAAIGSDLDGGYGTEQTPLGLDRISDLQDLDAMLTARGYSPEAIDGIFHGNWLRFFRRYLAAASLECASTWREQFRHVQTSAADHALRPRSVD